MSGFEPTTSRFTCQIECSSNCATSPFSEGSIHSIYSGEDRIKALQQLSLTIFFLDRSKNRDIYLSVGKFVGFLERGGGSGGGHFLFEVQSDIAKFLFDVTNDFALGGGGEGVTSLSEDFHEVIREVTASQIQTENGVGKRIS